MDSDKIFWFENAIPNIAKDVSYPKISIVTPSFNQGKFIEQTILSIIHQNYPNLEYIIIDGGSTDETVSIIKKYERFISYWVSEPDKGQTDAINKGFEKCTGEIFNWLNSDDIYAPGALSEIADLYKKNPNHNCFCGMEMRFKESKILNTSFGSTVEKDVESTLAKAHVDQPSTFIRRDAIQDIFPLDNTLRYCMFNQIWLHYFLTNGQNKIIRSSSVWVFFRYHFNSKTVSEGYKFRFEIHRLILSVLVAVSPENEEECKKRNYIPVKFKNVSVEIDKMKLKEKVLARVDKYKDDISLLYYEYAGYYRTMKLYENASVYLKKAIKEKPFRWIYWKAFLKNLFSN